MVEKNIDHNSSTNPKLVCNIADTALYPREASSKTINIIREMFGKS